MQETPPDRLKAALVQGIHGFGGGTSGRVKKLPLIRVIPSAARILMLRNAEDPSLRSDDTLR